jgi:hypothetical protein
MANGQHKALKPPMQHRQYKSSPIGYYLPTRLNVGELAHWHLKCSLVAEHLAWVAQWFWMQPNKDAGLSAVQGAAAIDGAC